MFRKILVANRGEIAVRVIRACREMGIGTVAVYSDADRKALHVRYADEAYHIGPPPSTQSYLRIDRVLDVARRSGAEAIHPGYGFLSENEEFARACEAARVVFIGPPAAAMELMGSKISSRHTLRQAGLPIVPGTDRNLESLDEVQRTAQEIGYPIMLKASAGGGGKGLRLVNSPLELESAFRNARSEAQNAFNDPSVYIEKYIQQPHHVEIQVLGDLHGNLIYLGERECSLQRRHQKVMEECPSPLVDGDLRQRMGETAVRIAGLAGYANAGTVEFLVDAEHNFYFLEMNTRLQVEHPVTELVAGIDLVKEQICIASGEPLRCKQEDVQLRGAALECRIYAEDPANNFFPSPGLITRLQNPSGPGVRHDSGVFEGWTVPIEYDPLLAKLVVWGADRGEAIARMRRALGEYKVFGIRTNIPFFRQILEHPDFTAGRCDTGFIDRVLANQVWPEDEPPREERVVAMLAAGLEAALRRNGGGGVAALRAGRQNHAAPSSAWKIAGREAALNRWPEKKGNCRAFARDKGQRTNDNGLRTTDKRMKFDLRFGAGSRPTHHRLELETLDSTGLAPGKVQFTMDGEVAEADWAEIAPGIYSLIVDGRSYEVLVNPQPMPTAPTREEPYTVTLRGRSHLVQVLDPRSRRRVGALEAGQGPQEILAPMPGKIVKVLVAESQQVRAGDGLLVIEAMKMQNEIRASRSGWVQKVYISEGAGVETGSQLVRLV